MTKYKHKLSTLTNNLLYSKKLNYYTQKFIQTGGALLDKDLDITKPDQVCETAVGVYKSLKIDSKEENDNKLGTGAYGSVYLLTNNLIIKIINYKNKEGKTDDNLMNDITVEFKNNKIVNDIAKDNKLFPSFYCVTLQDNEKIGLIVSEKLYPIYTILEKANKGLKFKDDFSNTNISEFLNQICFIFYSILDYYKKTKNILMHNDFKLDNLLLREITTTDTNYTFRTHDDTKIDVPFINYLNKKWLLVLNDFGESLTIDNSTGEINIKQAHLDSQMFSYKFFGKESNISEIEKLARDLFKDKFKNYIQAELMLCQYTDPMIFSIENINKIIENIEKYKTK